MENITMIAAIGANRELGLNNKLLWHIPEDLAFFKKVTLNKSIVMGINTFYSLPKVLPNRQSIVLTHQNVDLGKEILIFHSFEDLLKHIKESKQEFMIIGGASIYNQFLNVSDKMFLTEIMLSKTSDSYFPEFKQIEWEQENLGEYQYQNIAYKRTLYKKREKL